MLGAASAYPEKYVSYAETSTLASSYEYFMTVSPCVEAFKGPLDDVYFSDTRISVMVQSAVKDIVTLTYENVGALLSPPMVTICLA